MEPLDLSQRPPRAPREPLAGLDVLMAARTVDKIRATLPGGNLGDYQIAGFSQRFFETLDINEDEFRVVVSLAQSDEDVAAWLRKHVRQEQFDEYQRAILARSLHHRINDADFIAKYPHAKNHPLDMPIVDLLPLDDALAFGSR
jgi:hypothetical protein